MRSSVLRRHTKGADDTAMVTVAFLGELIAVRDQLRRASTLLPKQNPVESSILPSRLTLRICPRLVLSVAPFRSTMLTHLGTGLLECMWGPPEVLLARKLAQRALCGEAPYWDLLGKAVSLL